MLMFLQCMESSIHNGGGKIDPPLATLTETEIQIKGADFQPTSADVSKAKRKFPWSKKEVISEKNMYIYLIEYRFREIIFGVGGICVI